MTLLEMLGIACASTVLFILLKGFLAPCKECKKKAEIIEQLRNFIRLMARIELHKALEALKEATWEIGNTRINLAQVSDDDLSEGNYKALEIIRARARLNTAIAELYKARKILMGDISRLRTSTEPLDELDTAPGGPDGEVVSTMQKRQLVYSTNKPKE